MPNENLLFPHQNESSQEENSISEEEPSDNQPNEDKNERYRYPPGIPFILIFKFGERFGFYSFYVILTLYLHQELNFDEDTTTYIFHTFLMSVYFMTIFGALLADAYFGKFWIIFHLAILFITGEMLVFTGSTLNSIISMKVVSILGLFIMAAANGGLKPCASAIGGDQFEESQYKMRRRYFSLYFFLIYCSYILASFLTPVLRSHVQCFRKDTCYALAFGTAAVMSFVGTLVFFIGKPFYRVFIVQEGIFINVLKCIGYALSRKFKIRNEKKNHWLDYAEEQFDKSLISDLKALFHVLQVYIPLPIFVTLFHQVGSTWVLQASKMDGEFFGYVIKPDQMILLLPILLNIVIPTLEFVVYPLFNKLGLLRTYLQKIGTGGILNVFAFIMAGCVQLQIERDLPAQPEIGHAELIVINNSPCSINLTDNAGSIMLKAFETKIMKELPMFQDRVWKVTSSGCSAEDTIDKSFHLETQFEAMMITTDPKKLKIFFKNDDRIKLKNGNPRLRLFFRTENVSDYFLFRGNDSFTIVTDDTNSGMTDYWEIQPGTYKIFFKSKDSLHMRKPLGSWKFRTGGSYIIAVYQCPVANISNFAVIPTVKHNSVHILFQLPQYIVIATAEVMFSVTGVMFSYSEAPLSLKAVIQACWLLNFAYGNALLLILKSSIYILKDSHRFFIFGIILFIAMLVFMVIAHFYTYINDESERK